MLDKCFHLGDWQLTGRSSVPGAVVVSGRARRSAAGRTQRRRALPLAAVVGLLALVPAAASAAPAPPRRAAIAPLPAPWRLEPLAGTSLAGQGRWHPVGRLVDGHSTVYETVLELPQEPGVVAGIAWMDTKLLRATLYSGSISPGGFGWKYTAPVQAAAARTLVAAFNGGFQFPSTDGGYFSEGKMAFPLRVGAASLVIYRDGAAMIGQWGRDVSMSPNVVAVRQNLNLLVDYGKPVPGLSPYDISTWGPTLGGIPNVWRSGLGETANGAFVYVAGPSLTVVDLATLLSRARATRAMELDINPWWTFLSTFSPPSPTGLASPQNGTDLLPGMIGTPARFFDPSWARDFITMSARSA